LSKKSSLLEKFTKPLNGPENIPEKSQIIPDKLHKIPDFNKNVFICIVSQGSLTDDRKQFIFIK